MIRMLPTLPPADCRRMGVLNRILGVGFKRRPPQCKPIEHGTRYAYVRHKCRCEDCMAANREYQRANRANRPKGVPDHLHGRANTYNRLGCRCEWCTRSASMYRMKFPYGRAARAAAEERER
jgi:hypothetical protein